MGCNVVATNPTPTPWEAVKLQWPFRIVLNCGFGGSGHFTMSTSNYPYCRQILYHLSQQRSPNLCQLYLKNIHTQNLSKNTLDKKNKKKTFRGTVLISQIRSLAFSSPLELLVSSHFPILSWSKERCFSPRGEECQPNTLPASEYGMNEKIRVFAFFLLKTLGLCLLPAFPLWELAF